MNVLKAFLVALGAYALSTAIALVCLFVTIGITTGWGASRTGDAMMLMLTLVALIFLVSTVVVFFLEGYFVPNLIGRILTALGYGAMSGLTLLLFGFMSAIIFNR